MHDLVFFYVIWNQHLHVQKILTAQCYMTYVPQ